MTQKAQIQTPIGFIGIEADENGVLEIAVSDQAFETTAQKDLPQLVEAVEQLQLYFDGELHHFNLQLNPKGTDFQQSVWKALCQIPYGTTISYLDLAKELGDPKAVRAVAAANGRNPLMIVVPCHRVIGSDGSLTGYASGIWRKKWLLEHENAIRQLSLF